jgi:basic amino acid/polyamine antiporter, APA family
VVYLSKQSSTQLKRSIGLWSAVAINVGAIIGGGIFVVTGIVAGYAGSALIVSMALAAVIALFTGLSFVRLTTWQPIEGGVYEYGRQLISPSAGFLAGWMWLVSNTFTGAAVSLGFAYYLTTVFPNIPSNILAAVVCLIFTALNLIGTKESASVNNILVAIKLAVLTFFIIFGALSVKEANFSPFAPFSNGVLFGVFFIFFAYGGFARVTVVAEEIKDPKRNVPRALLLSLAISAVFYLLVGSVAVGLVGSTALAGSNSPLTTAVSATGSMLAVGLLLLGGLVATASVLLTSILGVSRMSYSMARRNDLPSVLAKLHSKFATPYYSILGTGILMAVLALFFDLTRVVAVSTFTLIFNYSIVNLSAYKLKINHTRQRVIPVFGLATCVLLLILIFFAALYSAIIGLVFLAVGAIIYALRKRFSANQAVRSKANYR